MKNIRILIEEFKRGEHRQRLKDIYVDEEMLAYQEARYVKALEKFVELYGEKDVELYSAPGRSEVGGNHTDHQHGKVLATSLNLDALAVVAKTGENRISMTSEGHRSLEIDLSVLEPQEQETSSSKALIRGVAAGLKERGYEIGGFEAYVVSDVLSGSGMSSSAAYEVLIGNIISGLYNDMKIDPVLIAQVSQYAENRYFGKPCGLMDQMACSVGGLINIDFADPGKPIVKQVHVAFESYGYSLCIVDTKGSHADLTPDYAAVPAEMKQAATCFGKEVLREVDEEEFLDRLPQLREQIGDRAVLRAIHLFEENKRVDRQVAALEQGDFAAFLKEIKASGDSSFKYLQNVYSNHKLQEQGVSVGLAVSDLALGDRGVSRVHGGGFAGTIQAFVPNDLVYEYKKALDHVFGEGACLVLKVRNYGGVRVL